MDRLNVDGDPESPALLAEYVVQDRTYNGFRIPVATERALRAYVSAMAQNDPNGDWSSLTIGTGAEGLTLFAARPDEIEMGDPYDTWDKVGEARNGDALYSLEGWTWELIESNVPPAPIRRGPITR